MLLLVTTKILKHALQLAGHFLHAWRTHDFNTHGWARNFDLDFFVIEFAFAQKFPKSLPRCTIVVRCDSDRSVI